MLIGALLTIWQPLDLNTLFTLLPRELKAEIFLHSLSNERPPIIGNSSPSSALLRVCKDWRNIALLTPRLWNCFQVVFDGATDVKHTSSDQLLSTVSLWVSRSADTSLSVTLAYIPPSATRGRFNAAVQAVLALLLNCSHRWECIRLIVPGMTLSPFIESAPHDMGRLQTLDLDLQGEWCASPFKVQKLGFDWSQLTELNLSLETGSILTLDECWDILSQASSLVECSMNAECVFHERTDADVLPLALHRFHLTLQGKITGQATPLVAFLQSLNLPLLSDLCLRWLVRETIIWEETHSAFVIFLTSLLPSLEVLHLAYLPVSEEQLLQILRCVPFLHHLILQFSMSSDHIGSRFFKAFSSSLDDPFLPHLRRLHIESSGVSWSSQALVKALDSRIRTGLQFSTYISEKAASSLWDVFEKWQGLDVHMRYIIIR